MEANKQQVRRISRCHAYISRHHPDVDVESIARAWIRRYARRWRMRCGTACEEPAHAAGWRGRAV